MCEAFSAVADEEEMGFFACCRAFGQVNSADFEDAKVALFAGEIFFDAGEGVFK